MSRDVMKPTQRDTVVACAQRRRQRQVVSHNRKESPITDPIRPGADGYVSVTREFNQVRQY